MSCCSRPWPEAPQGAPNARCGGCRMAAGGQHLPSHLSFARCTHLALLKVTQSQQARASMHEHGRASRGSALPQPLSTRTRSWPWRGLGRASLRGAFGKGLASQSSLAVYTRRFWHRKPGIAGRWLRAKPQQSGSTAPASSPAQLSGLLIHGASTGRALAGRLHGLAHLLPPCCAVQHTHTWGTAQNHDILEERGQLGKAGCGISPLSHTQSEKGRKMSSAS